MSRIMLLQILSSTFVLGFRVASCYTFKGYNGVNKRGLISLFV